MRENYRFPRPRSTAICSFERAVLLPTHILADKAEASYKNGVLEMRLPKISSSTRR
ncbi:MAG: Hsp20/alpha crystallin family protein [Candidatus Sumerlaeota bacterium]|nr:Hsp20/alpha crystallin family protein [Candidatus Sumerlaeota bacterium]